jgi:hypothetical protein
VTGARVRRLVAAAGADRLGALAGFYGERLGLSVERAADRVAVAVGAARVELAAAPGAPFTHFALLVPGNRFVQAFEWASARVPLLAATDGNPVFDFDFWDATACYFEDPAGNVVELIAHRGVEETSRAGFAAGDLAGISEVGLVVDDRAGAARALEAELGLAVWDGDANGPGLAFAGERARTLILAPPGRRWLPTDRPAETCPTEVELELDLVGDVRLEGGRIRVWSAGARRVSDPRSRP